MWDLALAAYVANLTLIITHEIDSAYWEEWGLLRLPGGIGGFLAMHLAAVPVLLWGLLLVAEGSFAGVVASLALAGVGLLAFSIHAWFLSRGRREFRHPMSIGVLIATLVVSLAQIAIALSLTG